MSLDHQPSAVDRSTPAHPPSSAVARLCNALDSIVTLCADSADSADPSHLAAFASGLRAALAEAAADPALLSPAQCEGCADTYRRHLLAADPQGRYAIATLVWMPGQASPIHAHQTWCGYVVLDGALTETVYAWNDARQCASETRTHERVSGAVSFVRAGRGGIHRLGNASGAAAVSLHVYGVEGSQIATHVNDLLQVAIRQERRAERAYA